MLIDQEFNILYASEISLAVLKAQVAELATIEGINRLFLVINLKERIFDSVQDLLEAINDITESDSLLGLTMALTSNQAAQAYFDQIKENPDLSIQHNHSYIDIISQGTNKKSVAKRLYEQKGFVVEGTKKNAMMIDGDFVDEFYMAKLL